MPIAATCPYCRRLYRLPDHQRGLTVRCKDCQKAFTIAADAADAADAGAELEEREEVAPPLESRPLRRRPDEEAVERPRRRPKRTKGLGEPVLIGGVVAFIVLVGAIVGGMMWSLNKKDDHAVGPQTQAGPPNPPAAQDTPSAGQPPAAADNPPPQSTSPYAITLSSGKIGHGFGARKTFSLSYRFENGGPGSGTTYYLILKSSGGESEASYTGMDLKRQGELEIEQVGFGFGGQGPYEARMEVDQPGGERTLPNRRIISNTIKLEP